MKLLVALAMGLFGGFLLFAEAAVVFAGQEGPSLALAVGTFLGGTALFTWLIVRDARSFSRVFSRGFLIGAAEWFAMIPIAVIFSAKLVSQARSASTGNAESAGAVLGGGLVASMGVGLAVFMTIVCLIGFTIFFLLGRQMRPEKRE